MAEGKSPSEIIKHLGGTKAVAGALECGKPVVSNWKRSKIPADRWAAIVAAFPDKITFEELAAQVPYSEAA